MSGRLAPELTVTKLDVSLRFWRDLCGFTVEYGRAEEGFAFLTQADVCFMLEQDSGEGRRWRTAPLEHPLGRGINFEITLQSIESVLHRLHTAGVSLYMSPERKVYRTSIGERTVRQFLVQDPDGYLLRFAEVLSDT